MGMLRARRSPPAVICTQLRSERAWRGVLIGSTVGLCQAIGIDVEPHIESWILPFGIAGQP
jgi:hypothetical protein